MEYITTAHGAELNAERVMRSWGYSDARATTGGSDGGIDVRSSRALAQVKWRGAQVSRDEIQKLYGARGADKTKDLFFFAASGYSKPAIAAASELGVRLFTYDPTGAVQQVNGSVLPNVSLPPLNKDQTLWFGVIAFGLIASIILMLIIWGSLDKY